MKIFDAIQQVVPCPKTKSIGCQCDRLDRLSEAEETIKAIATLEHTEGDVSGSFRFKQKPGEPTIIKGIVKGLEPGKHGFHIHEYGDLSDGCASAGAHYNPDGVEHGNLKQGHVGDLGNIVADKSGTARFQIKAERVNLSDVVGRAIVVHADEDDLGKGGDEESLKTGNAGDRLGCGVIRLREVVEENFERNVNEKHFDRDKLPQIRKPDLDDSPFQYKEGTISLSNLKPVQSQRVKGLSKKAENIFLDNEIGERPFIIDKEGFIINGHHRYDAANVLGIKKVPAVMVQADIEDVMNHFSHKTSDKEVMPEHYFKKLLETKLEEATEDRIFEMAWDKFIELVTEEDVKDAVLVHGYVTDQKGPTAGQRVPHAWIELTGSGIVIDPEANNIRVNKKIYYKAGAIIPGGPGSPGEVQLAKFNVEQAIKQLKTTGHFGPWGLDPLYNKNNDPQTQDLFTQPGQQDEIA